LTSKLPSIMLYHHIIIYSPLKHVKIIRDPPKLTSEKIWPIKVKWLFLQSNKVERLLVLWLTISRRFRYPTWNFSALLGICLAYRIPLQIRWVRLCWISMD
jgi:hypothetical protein